MIITCKACNTSFNLDDKIIKSTGSKVRCSVCASVFTVFPEQESSFESKDGRADGNAAFNASMMAPADTDDDTVDEIDEAVSKALDDDLEDLDFGSDESGDDQDATMIANLDDDDDNLDLDLSSEPDDDDDRSATVVADLDDDDEFDISLDEQPDSDATVIVDLEGDDLDLDIPVESNDDDDSVTMVITDLDEDESIGLDDDLDDDLSLDLEEDADIGAPIDKDTAETDDDLDLSLDFEIDEDVSSSGAPDDESDDVEMEDLTLDFDLEVEGDEATPASDTDESADEELDLAFDLEDDGMVEEKTEADGPVLEDDLDMTSLEEMFDEESPDDSATMIVGEDELSELELELDDGPVSDGEDQSRAAEESLADLELELDEEGKAGAPVGGDDDSQLDLSEIEKMLEEPQAGGQKISVPEQDLDLDIEASLESEKWMSESGNDQIVADEELDLSELEQVLENVDTDADDDAAEDQELELDLSDDTGDVKSTETVAADNDLEFDLSDFEDDVPDKSFTDAASEQPADMELEFEVDEDGPGDQALEDEGLEETVAMVDAAAAPAKEVAELDDDTLVTAPPIASEVDEPTPVKKEKNKSLIFLLLIILILGGAGYGSYYFLNKSGIDIPFISDYLKPKVQDPGNLKLATHDINSRFIDNTNVGKLFVITGKVKNGYAENRGMVSITGKIFTSGKVAVHEETVYCGNVMSDLELSNLEWDKIQARLANRLGDNRSNVKIEPGKSVPFMVVFSGLPDNLEEFTIEVAGSTSLK